MQIDWIKLEILLTQTTENVNIVWPFVMQWIDSLLFELNEDSSVELKHCMQRITSVFYELNIMRWNYFKYYEMTTHIKMGFH